MKMTDQPCSVEGCDRNGWARGMCRRHWRQWYRQHGTPKPRSWHGESGTETGRGRSPTYNSWMAMKASCNIPTSGTYKKVGARGIKVCERWLGVDGYLNFKADMDIRPPGAVLGRIDATKDFTPENTRWMSRTEKNLLQEAYAHNSTGMTGVRYRKATGHWFASIYEYNGSRHLGTFDTKEEAMAARQKAVQEKLDEIHAAESTGSH